MKRSGFKRPTIERKSTVHKPIPQDQLGTVADASAMAVAMPKTVAMRNPALLAMARGRECLLQFPNLVHYTDTVVACHSNLMKHGKGKGRKADDHYTVWGCAACHNILDHSRISADEKERVFMAALARQIEAWKAITKNMLEEQKTRDAAQWALDLHVYSDLV